MKKPFYISREKEYDLILYLLSIVDDSKFTFEDTAIIMASPDYSATVAMHLAHSWSRSGEVLSLIPVDVTYPDETADFYIEKMQKQKEEITNFKQLILVEAGIIRGGNWTWMLNTLYEWGYSRSDITLVALCENVHSKVKSDYVGQYYDNDTEDLTFYFERFNRHWSDK